MVAEGYEMPLEVHRVKGAQRVQGELGAWVPPKPIAKSQGGSKASLGWGSGKEVRLAYGQWGRQVKRAGQGAEQVARRSSWWSRGGRAEQGAEQGWTLGSRVRGGGLSPVAVPFVPPNPNPKAQGGAKDPKEMGSDVVGEVDAEQRAQGVQGAMGAAVQGGCCTGCCCLGCCRTGERSTQYCSTGCCNTGGRCSTGGRSRECCNDVCCNTGSWSTGCCSGGLCSTGGLPTRRRGQVEGGEEELGGAGGVMD